MLTTKKYCKYIIVEFQKYIYFNLKSLQLFDIIYNHLGD